MASIGTTGNAIIAKALKDASPHDKSKRLLPADQEAGLRSGVEYLANKYGVEADWILMVFVMESEMDYLYYDSNGYGGYINIGRKYFDTFGFSVGMSASNQVKAGGPIDKSFAEHFGPAKTKDLGSFYTSNVYPAYVNYGPYQNLTQLTKKGYHQANILYNSDGTITKTSMGEGVIKTTKNWLGNQSISVATNASTSAAAATKSSSLSATTATSSYTGNSGISTLAGNTLTILTADCKQPTTLREAIIWTGCQIIGQTINQISAVGNSNIAYPGAASTSQTITTSETKTGQNYTGSPVPGGYILPVGGDPVVTSGFGPRNVKGGSKNHPGYDIGVPMGTPIYAPRAGVVYSACNDGGQEGCGGYGRLIILDHGETPGIPRGSAYGHCKDITVKVGQVVKQGDVIGHVGSEGHSTGPHLHFELRYNLANHERVISPGELIPALKKLALKAGFST